MVVKCAGITRGGSRCSSPVLPGSSFCFLHAPEMAEARREAARKGGRNRSAKARAAKQIPEAATAAELAGYLTALFRGVMVGRIEPRVGTAAATIAKVLIEARAVADQPTIEDLQDQLVMLRTMIERTTGGRAA